MASVRTQLNDLATALASAGAPEAAGQVDAVINEMPDDELDLLFGASSGKLEELTQAYERIADLGEKDAGRSFAKGPDESHPTWDDLKYEDSCPKSLETSTIDMQAAIAALDVAKAIWSGADRACTQSITGVSATLGCIAGDLILFAAELVVQNFEFCNDDILRVEAVARSDRQVLNDIAQTEQYEDLKSALSTHDSDIESQLSTHDSDIESQLSTHDTDIESQLNTHDSDLKAQLLQHDIDIKEQLDRIEALLNLVSTTQLEQLLHAMGGKRTGVMYTDRLAEVCDAAEGAITEASALQYAVGNAGALLAEGRSLMATDPKKAHDLCRAAYRDATGRTKKKKK